MHKTTIKQVIETHIPGSIVIINGEDGIHFEAIVISEQFLAKTRVQQQQLVYNALGDAIQNGDIHALSLKTFTPEAWAAQTDNP